MKTKKIDQLNLKQGRFAAIFGAHERGGLLNNFSQDIVFHAKGGVFIQQTLVFFLVLLCGEFGHDVSLLMGNATDWLRIRGDGKRKNIVFE
jgi:hypothetical protein